MTSVHGGCPILSESSSGKLTVPLSKPQQEKRICMRYLSWLDARDQPSLSTCCCWSELSARQAQARANCTRNSMNRMTIYWTALSTDNTPRIFSSAHNGHHTEWFTDAKICWKTLWDLHQMHRRMWLLINQAIRDIQHVSMKMSRVYLLTAQTNHFNPLKPTVAIWVQPQSILCQTELSCHLSFLTSGHSDAQGWASECQDIKNYKWRLNPVWHRMLCSCTHMATVGFKGLNSNT